jgi:hypothetical protein
MRSTIIAPPVEPPKKIGRYIIETYRDRIRLKLNLDSGTRLTHAATQWVLENG